MTAKVWSWTVRTLGLAAAYYASGKLGLLLAIPPGYATAVWPPSGIAFAAVLAWGPRTWPGILVGSFLLNVGTSFDPDAVVKSIALPLSIGAGATAQALVGLWLVRRFVTQPLELLREWDILRFVLLGGPCSCVVNATISVTSLGLWGVVSWDQYAFNWWTWWVGDTIGVAVVTPVILAWIGEPREVWRRRRLTVTAPLAVLFALAVVLFVRVSAWEQSRLQLRFESQAAVVARAISQRFGHALETLQALASLFAAVPSTGGTEFHAFAERLLARSPGIHALTWDVVVPHAERGRFEASPDGPPAGIRERDAAGSLVPAAVRDAYVVIAYIEPGQGSESAIGFDVASDPDSLEGLRRAASSGEAAASGPIRLVRRPGQQAGILVFQPVFGRSLSGPRSTGAAGPLGYATAVLLVGDLMEAALGGVDHRGMSLTLADEAAPADQRWLWPLARERDGARHREPPSAGPGQLAHRTMFELAGRPWSLAIMATPEYMTLVRSWQPWMVLAGALAITALLGAFLLDLTGRPLLVERFGAQRAGELSRANLELQREIAERQAAEATLRAKEGELRQAQKMEAVGQLAGGIAHDFNNLLTVILGYSDLALGQTDAGDPRRNLLQEVQRAGERAQELTRQLLAFSRKQVLQPKILDLNLVVWEMERILRRLIGERIELITTLESQAGRVRADPGQLQQVIMNLAINARDAMPRGGRLALATRTVVVPSTGIPAQPELGPGRYVVLSVSDTGTGMDEAILSHVFEPFFTTKEKGSGTGLGLSTVYGIVKQSGGHVTADSAPGRGTTFRIYLPCLEEAEIGEPAAPRPGSSSLARGCETILIVEDEEAVRVLCRSILAEAGYAVLEARNGEEALARLEGHPETIDLLVTDMIMPGMTGAELAQAVLQRRPGTKVLYVSGYAEVAVHQHGVIAPRSAFLAKPFTPGSFARKVREALDAGAEADRG